MAESMRYDMWKEEGSWNYTRLKVNTGDTQIVGTGKTKKDAIADWKRQKQEKDKADAIKLSAGLAVAASSIG